MTFELFSHMTFVIASQLAESFFFFFKHPSQGLLQHVVSKYKRRGQDREQGVAALRKGSEMGWAGEWAA